MNQENKRRCLRKGTIACLHVMLVLALSACGADIISSSEKHISIKALTGRGANAAYEMAEKHCQKFGKVAVPSVVDHDITTFRCE